MDSVAIGYAKKQITGLASGFDHAEDVGNNTLRFYWNNGTTTDVVLSNGSGSTTLGEDFTTNITVGGLTANTNLTSDMELKDIIKAMCVKHIPPVVAIIKPSKILYKNGSKLNIQTIGVTVTKKSSPISTIKYYMDGTYLGVVPQYVSSGGTFNLDVSRTLSTTSTFKVIATDSEGATSTDTLTYYFVDPIYTGYETDGVVEKLQLKGDIVFDNVTCTLDKPVIKYPKAFGQPKSFVDVNGFSMLNSFTVTEETINSVDYYVYTNNSVTTVSNFKYIMKF